MRPKKTTPTARKKEPQLAELASDIEELTKQNQMLLNEVPRLASEYARKTVVEMIEEIAHKVSKRLTDGGPPQQADQSDDWKGTEETSEPSTPRREPKPQPSKSPAELEAELKLMEQLFGAAKQPREEHQKPKPKGGSAKDSKNAPRKKRGK